MGGDGIGVTLYGPLHVSRGKANIISSNKLEVKVVIDVNSKPFQENLKRMSMLISDDPRARSFAKREFWRGFRWGVTFVMVFTLIGFGLHLILR